jgi:hypothetical protein
MACRLGRMYGFGQWGQRMPNQSEYYTYTYAYTDVYRLHNCHFVSFIINH